MHRERVGYTRDQISNKIKVSAHAYRRWERGETKPNIEQAMDCAEVLGIDMNELCAGPKPDALQTIEICVEAGQAYNVFVRGADEQEPKTYTSPVRISQKSSVAGALTNRKSKSSA
jgi:DNA-binding XRE family transcriptional regulator